MQNQINNSGLTAGFRAAIYCRISREDSGLEQSESIVNQRDFLQRYVKEQGWQLYDVYIDDGFTGTSFDRPGFKRLLADIEAKRVNLVITKDLSRLGRDYITTGHYIERYFPEKRVRYIAVNDNIDTYIDSMGNDITPFRSVINDLYARDISVKVRAAMDSKRKEGKFIGAFPPYGYLKDPTDKNKLILDEETAPVVAQIFQLYVEGWGLSQIARWLNEEGIITPLERKDKLRGLGEIKKSSPWNHATVKMILQNPTYMGNLRQRVNKKINYKSKGLIRVPEEDWIIAEGTHTPIIDPILFMEVKNKINKKKKHFKYGKTKRIFSGMVYCADCGRYMTFQTSGPDQVYLICSTYKRYTARYCSRHSINEETLKNLVLGDLKQITAFLDASRLRQYVKIPNDGAQRPLLKLQKRIRLLNSRVTEIDRAIKTLYTDRVNQLITAQQFSELTQGFINEKNDLLLLEEKLNIQLLELERQGHEKIDLQSMAEGLLNMESIDERILEKLVEKIEVFEDCKIKIYYRFKSPLA